MNAADDVLQAMEKKAKDGEKSDWIEIIKGIHKRIVEIMKHVAKMLTARKRYLMKDSENKKMRKLSRMNKEP